MKSEQVTRGSQRAPHRSLFYAIGYTPSDLDRPLIGVVNSQNEVIPGHIHLDAIAQAVKAGIYSAGGTPIEFPVIGICDGIAMGHLGMHYSLPSRELIADSVESMALAHALDGLVLIPNCDKIIPGMLMAAARLDLPALVVSGGPMLAGRFRGRDVDLSTVFEAVAKVEKGEWSEADLEELTFSACPGCGSCAGMFTANTMNCLTEALGIALPGNGTIPAVNAARLRLAKEAGRRIVDLIRDDLRPSRILVYEAFVNAITVDMAMGGSTNTVLHLMAIAREAGVDLSLEEFDRISRRTPYLASISPASPLHIQDLDEAGGIPALMKELSRGGLIHTELPTVTGRTVGENIASAAIRRPDVIRTLDRPYRQEGGLAILYGNLAPEGAVVKAAAVAEEMLTHRGPARIFNSEENAVQAILGGAIRRGDVVVIRYEGPKGGPGMREMLAPTASLAGPGSGLAHRRALFRRHAGGGHRPHLPRGRRRGSHRPAAGRGPHRDRHPGPAAPGASFGGGTGEASAGVATPAAEDPPGIPGPLRGAGDFRQHRSSASETLTAT